HQRLDDSGAMGRGRMRGPRHCGAVAAGDGERAFDSVRIVRNSAVIKSKRRRLALFALCLISASGAKAACLGTMNVSATLLNFNTYNPLSGIDKDAENTINVTCNLIAGIGLLPSFTVKLGPGTANSYAPRQLTASSNKLNYNLFKDSGRTIIWGD